jgi:hypothetical protein
MAQIIKAGIDMPATSIAINNGPPRPGRIQIEMCDGGRYWKGTVTGFHAPGDIATVTMRVSSDPDHVFTGQALIEYVEFPEDAEPVTEFSGRGPLDRRAVAQ